MKTFTKFLTMLAVAALFATGCVNEEPPYKEDPNPEPAGTTGYLSIGNLSMTVVYDETEIRPDDTSDETQAARTASGTRATAPDVDSFIVEILDADNAQVLEMTYAELKEQLKTPMELKVGVYRMEVRSEDTMPGADWEHPVYGATSDFTITKAQTTSPEEVVCTLQNIKVSVEYSPELADMLADTSKATVSLGDTSLDFSKTETRAAYFKPLALENTLNFAFDGTFADTGEYDPLQHQTVYIYNDEGGLLRKYTSKEACPERLELLAGTYRVAVEAGEEAPADFTKRLYKGEETFTVKPGETTNVAVVCQIVNTVVEVKFDDSILQNLAPGYSVWIAGGEKVDEQAAEAGSVPALRFTAEGTGYYTLPAGMTSLAWLFRGTHVEGKNVEMEDYIPNVKAGGKYTLTFKYSPDLPGYIDCVLISVDPGTDDKDDEIIFSPDPAVISEGFDIAEIQKYVSGEKKYRILAFSELTRFTVSVGDKSYDALNGTTEGISLEPVDKYNVRLTLSDAFFASCQAGDQKVTLRIEDANGGSSEVATTYRLEGLVPVTADDYDLWANTVTLRVVSFTPGTTVQFGLRSSGGEWQPMAGTSQGNDFITATYAPQWEEKTTADWSTPATVLPYSRLKKGTGISAGNTYDYKATVGSKELSGRFTADEGAPMTDGSLESWRSAQQFPGSGTNYTFWGSGYNPFAKELCTRDEAMPGRVGTYCAKLSATYNTLAKVPAPGNLFTGDFAIQVLGGMGGNVSFGKKFAYNARPRAVRFKYHATIGEVNYNLHGGKIPVGEMDKARIFVCIVDWTAQQKVFAGTKAPTGTWDPETQTEAANGPIIGYASKFIEETTQGDEMVEVILPINYYQDTAAAPDGKYNIVVSCSTSAYGDYMDACTTNVMYVDDFEWVY